MSKKSSPDHTPPDQNPPAVLGRPKLIEERVPFTTSLTPRNKKKLEVLATLRERRKADLLNEILAHYFEQCCNDNEHKMLLSLD